MATKRKRRKPRGSRPAPAAAAAPRPLPRGYERGRQKDEEARRALKPLAPGERPTAVTVGAIAAALLAVANLVAVVLGWDGGTDADAGQALAGSLLVTAVVCVVAVGMWQAKYWAVLGMQTLLAITIVICSLGLIGATSIVAALILLAMLAGAGALFWFLVKAMARIQMPERPGASRR
jgi:hypothetical protein